MSVIPPGFAPHTRSSPATAPWEPLFAAIDHEAPAFALACEIAEAHCNARGFLHGGVAAGLADNAMGLSYGLALRGEVGGGLVTVSLSLDYAGSGRIGQWLVVRPRVLKAGSGMGFVDAVLTADEAIVARASATFRRLPAPSGDEPRTGRA